MRAALIASVERIGREAVGPARWMLARGMALRLLEGKTDAELRQLLDVVAEEAAKLKGMR